MPSSARARSRVALLAASVSACLAALVACGSPVPARSPEQSRYSKVLVIAEENKSFRQVIGTPQAPFVSRLAASYGSALAMDAGYPAACPSLAAYVILTSGDRRHICDDDGPAAHPLAGDNVFAQVARTGRQWRVYAESMPDRCAATDSADGRYLVRHVPAVYYVSERLRCGTWTVPSGTPAAGALHDDLAAGTLPAYGFITPNACNDMHGASGCEDGTVERGDRWLSGWIPQILAAPEYRAGHVVVIITWDEGTAIDNHIPTLVISPSTTGVRATTGYTHCSTLRTVQEILRTPLLGCAARAPSMLAAFGLR